MRRVEKTASLLNGKEQYCFYEVEKTVFISKHKKLIFFSVIKKQKKEGKRKSVSSLKVSFTFRRDSTISGGTYNFKKKWKKITNRSWERKRINLWKENLCLVRGIKVYVSCTDSWRFNSHVPSFLERRDAGRDLLFSLVFTLFSVTRVHLKNW